LCLLWDCFAAHRDELIRSQAQNGEYCSRVHSCRADG
jgi:hypothetical protein